MFTTEPEYRQRINTCKACEFYQRGWCGTAVVGTLVDNPEGGRRKRTCGCNIALKAKLSCEECGHPFEKRWHKTADKPTELLSEIGSFVDSIGDRISAADKERLFTYRDTLTGKKTRNKQTNCVACIKEAITELKNAYKQL